MNAAVIPFDMSAPGDARSLRRALGRLPLRDVLQLAVVAKIEGPATLNDVSRQMASERIGAEVQRAGGPALWRRSLQILSAGCEGIITPGGWLIASLRGLRGARTTVLTSELPADKQLRAAASGVVGVTLGSTRAFISEGTEHQAAPGGCLAAVIRSAA
jgi:hypothetical protein